MSSPVNKTMDRGDLDTEQGRTVSEDLNRLISDLDRRGLRTSSWYGLLDASSERELFQRLNRGFGYEPLHGSADDDRFPWFLYWEIAWVCRHADFSPGQTVLDIGGSSSLFSYYLASRGLRVTTIDLEPELVDNANAVAEATGWELENVCLDVRELNRPGSPLVGRRFDHVTSICVFEHIPASTRVDASTALAQAVRPGGTVSLTFDYLNPSRLARINSPEDVLELFVTPTGLTPRGHPHFVDNGKRYLLHPAYHPAAPWSLRWHNVRGRGVSPLALAPRRRRNHYSFGALFLGSH